MLKKRLWLTLVGGAMLCVADANSDCAVYCPPQFGGCGSYVNAGGACNNETVRVSQTLGGLCIEDICIE